MSQPTDGPALAKFGAKYIDNGFWRITEPTARKLCAPDPLPRSGHYRVIAIDGYRCEVHQTIVKGVPVWAVMTTSSPARHECDQSRKEDRQ
jgi:hypothetical protein